MRPINYFLIAFTLTVVLALMLGCATTRVELGTGMDARDRDVAVMLRLQQPINDRLACEYMHVSNLLDGEPFNHDKGFSLDFAGCTVKVH